MVTKECLHCGKNMIYQEKGIALMTYPPQYPMEWFCGCGHKEDAGVEWGMTQQQSSIEKWKEANK